MRSTSLAVFAALVIGGVAGCEDGPDQIFEKNTGNPDEENGFSPGNPFVEEGNKPYDTAGGGNDAAGRARFCSIEEQEAQVQQMVLEPIIPNVSIGGIPLWKDVLDPTAPHEPILADDLIGRPEDGLWCDPDGVYADAFTWGPEFEVIMFFNTETRLVEEIIAYSSYLGTLTGEYTDPGVDPLDPIDDEVKTLTLQNKERITIDGVELDTYPQWNDPAVVSTLHRMLRETYFDAETFPANYDCVALGLCTVFYTDPDNKGAQQGVQTYFQDSGVLLDITADGYINWIWIEQVRKAPFEINATVTMDSDGGGSLDPALQSSCTVRLDDQLSWQQFVANCAGGDEDVLSIANYDVATSRDSVFVTYNGIDFGFQRDLTQEGKTVLRDGERPDPDDQLFSMTFTRDLNANLPQFDPVVIGTGYRDRVLAMLADSVAGPACTVDPDCDMANGWSCVSGRCENGHPFFVYGADPTSPLQGIADLKTQGQYADASAPLAVDRIVDADGELFIPRVIQDIQTLYEGLTAEQKLQVVGLDVYHPVTFIHPWVDSVLDQFSFGASRNAPFHELRTTDDRKWSIGYAYYVNGGVDYRLIVQYSLNWGGITAVTVERGGNAIDEILGPAPGAAFWSIADALPERGSVFGINGTGVAVHRDGIDRQLETLRVTLTPVGIGAEPETLTVTGYPIEDESGFTRQIRGERYEFVPADEVYLYGRTTAIAVFVEADGQIGRVWQPTFKGSLSLCKGPLAPAELTCSSNTSAGTCSGSAAGCFWTGAVSECHKSCRTLSDAGTCGSEGCYWQEGACSRNLDLSLQFGDDVRKELDGWTDVLNADTPGSALTYMRQCDIVYNYSLNGNVLDSVSSIANKVSFTTVDGVAVDASIWR